MFFPLIYTLMPTILYISRLDGSTCHQVSASKTFHSTVAAHWELLGAYRSSLKKSSPSTNLFIANLKKMTYEIIVLCCRPITNYSALILKCYLTLHSRQMVDWPLMMVYMESSLSTMCRLSVSISNQNQFLKERKINL